MSRVKSSLVVYLDHAAATPVDERVVQAMNPYLTELFFNPSAPYAPAIAVRRDYEAAKQDIARALGAKADELIMTAGATESIAIAFASVNGHVVTTNAEHHAVLNAAKARNHTLATVDPRGMVQAEAIRDAITEETELVSVAIANNELGTIQPIRDIAEMVRKIRADRLSHGNTKPLYFHCDASQGVGQLDVSVARLGVDMLTVNAAKVYGPKQVGLLWAASHVRLKPLIAGGGQERGIRSGTENVAGVIGFAKALSLVTAKRKHESHRLAELRDMVQQKLTDSFPEAVVSGHSKHRLAGHLHISFPQLDAERVLFALEARGILVATGSACAANKGTRSHVLTAIGLAPEVADGSLRITLGHDNTRDQLETATEVIIETVKHEYDRMTR